MQKVNYHTHTLRCGHADMDYYDEDYVKDFIKMGFKKFAFTDHCPYEYKLESKPNIRMDYSKKEEYLESIKKLKEKYSGQIEIETGFEIEYSPFHKEYLLKLKNEVDKLVLGQHYITKPNGEVKLFTKEDGCQDDESIYYYENIKEAVELGIPSIIAHPDIYLKHKASFTENDLKIANLIGSLAEKYDVPLELNLHDIFCRTYFLNKTPNEDPFEVQVERLNKVTYPNKRFWEELSKYNVRILFGLDVHHKREIAHFKDDVNLAKIILGEELINKLNFVEDI